MYLCSKTLFYVARRYFSHGICSWKEAKISPTVLQCSVENLKDNMKLKVINVLHEKNYLSVNAIFGNNLKNE